VQDVHRQLTLLTVNDHAKAFGQQTAQHRSHIVDGRSRRNRGVDLEQIPLDPGRTVHHLIPVYVEPGLDQIAQCCRGREQLPWPHDDRPRPLVAGEPLDRGGLERRLLGRRTSYQPHRHRRDEQADAH
jgi:hypothetical protein